MTLNLGKPNLDVFSKMLIEACEKDKNVCVVTSDSRNSGKLSLLAEKLPGQLIEVGVAEQDLVGISAGLAMTGKRVFAVSPASFLTARALEQIKNDICYSDNAVKIIGLSAGVSYGALGSTHHSLHDIAVFRAINNITIIVPADNFETRETIHAAMRMQNPVYIRFGKRPMYDLHNKDICFEVGKAITMKEGTDIAFIATGETVYPALMAALELEKESISTRVVSMHTIKPLDETVVLESARTCGVVITVEEHSINGGLGEACASLILQAGIAVRFKIVGIPDEYTVTGSQLDIFNHYGISQNELAKAARTLLCQ